MAPSNEELELVNNPGSWTKARSILKAMGPVPSSVGNTVKCLWKDHLASVESNTIEISFSSKSAVRLVDKSSVLKMPLYFAAQDLYPERFSEVQEDEASTALIRILNPGLFAAFLSLVYLHRRFNKICPMELWEELSKEYVLNTELGYLLGKSSERIGKAVGTLMGGARFAALALLLKNNPDGFLTYRAKRKAVDVHYEHEHWGCDHGQIAALIIKNLGFATEQFQIAGAIRGYAMEPLKDQYKAWNAAVALMDGVKAGHKLETVDLSLSGIEIPATDLENISKETNTLFEKGTTFGWMLKGSKE